MYQEPWTPPAGDQLPPPPGVHRLARDGRRPPPPLPPYPPPTPSPYSLRAAAPGAAPPSVSVQCVVARGAGRARSSRSGMRTLTRTIRTRGSRRRQVGGPGERRAHDRGGRRLSVWPPHIVYGFWEHAKMGTGNDPSWRTGTHWADSGLRRSGLGHHRLSGARLSLERAPRCRGSGRRSRGRLPMVQENWSSGTELTMGGFGEFRAGFGADTRQPRFLALAHAHVLERVVQRACDLATRTPKEPDPVARGDRTAPSTSTLGGSISRRRGDSDP